VTTRGVLRVVAGLEAAGFETIVFHAVGSGGAAMEAMIRDGQIDGVIDYTPSEMVDFSFGGIFSAGEDRLTAANATGVPHVLVPGGMELLNLDPRRTIPPAYDVPSRKLIVHNETVCAVRTTAEESHQLGVLIGSRMSSGSNPRAVIVPTDGFTSYSARPSGPWIDAEADSAFVQGLRESLNPVVDLVTLPLNVNDERFADHVVAVFLQLWQGKDNERRE
jgi:uncharacterized protein (UPF0261 family)